MQRSIISFAQHYICYPDDFSCVGIIFILIISRNITTLLNYMTAFRAGSDFSRSAKFPEVYRGQGVSKELISDGERAVTGQGRDTAYSVLCS